MPRKRSAWLAHVMKLKAKHKGVPLKEILKKASATYKKKSK